MSKSNTERALRYMKKYLENRQLRNQTTFNMNIDETPQAANNLGENPVILSAETGAAPAGAEQPFVKEEPIPEGEKHSYKISDEDFIAIYNTNYGLCSPTARAIEDKYGISYSRQAVFYRANTLRQRIENHKSVMLDEAKATLYEAIRQNRDVRTKFRASLYFLSKTEYGRY